VQDKRKEATIGSLY